MPCYSVGGGKYQLGHNGPVYKDKSTCERAYRAYLAKKYKGHHSAPDGKFLERRKRKFGIKE
jgi:hypothetical protein